MKNKPIIFLDFDGLKYDTLEAHAKYLNKRYNISSKAEDYKNNPPLNTVINKYLEKDQQITATEAYIDLSENFLSSPEWHDKLEMINGAMEVIPLLTEKYALWTVTARQKSGKHVIEQLYEKHIPGCISGIHCVWEHIGNGEYIEISKLEFIKNFPGEKAGFVDDSPKEIIPLQGIIPCYLFDQHRMYEDHPGIKQRVYSWKEIGNVFL